MAQLADPDVAATQKRTQEAQDTASVSGSSASGGSARKRRRRRKAKKNGSQIEGDSHSPVVNGRRAGGLDKRRHSLSKAARDPRDEPPTKKRAIATWSSEAVRSPSPAIDFEGLSRPSMCPKKAPSLACQQVWSPRQSLFNHPPTPIRPRNPRTTSRDRGTSCQADGKDARCRPHPTRMRRRGS